MAEEVPPIGIAKRGPCVASRWILPPQSVQVLLVLPVEAREGEIFGGEEAIPRSIEESGKHPRMMPRSLASSGGASNSAFP